MPPPPVVLRVLGLGELLPAGILDLLLGIREHGHRLVQLHALAYNLGNFLRTVALPDVAEHWSLTTLRDKLIKIGGKIVRHGRYVTFQMAEVAVPRALFADILRRIDRLRSKPAPA